jgi:DNA-binding LacI/PurR family transcriptional regulator
MKLSAHDVRRVAVESCSHDRTVRRYLADPARVRSTSRARIEGAMVRLGFAVPTAAPDANGARHAG